jgi:hypothetical protein
MNRKMRAKVNNAAAKAAKETRRSRPKICEDCGKPILRVQPVGVITDGDSSFVIATPIDDQPTETLH